MTATHPKQTAGNNATLARVKKAMNAKIYKLVMTEYDAMGREAARAMLSLYFNDEPNGRAALAAIFDGE